MKDSWGHCQSERIAQAITSKFNLTHLEIGHSPRLLGYPYDMTFSERIYEGARKRAIALLRLESIVLIALIIYLALLDALRRKPLSAPLALAGDFIALALGAIGLYACSISFAKGKSWGRAPAVLANLIALGVAYFMASGKFYIGAIPLGLLAFATAFSSTFGYRE